MPKRFFGSVPIGVGAASAAARGTRASAARNACGQVRRRRRVSVQKISHSALGLHKARDEKGNRKDKKTGSRGCYL